MIYKPIRLSQPRPRHGATSGPRGRTGKVMAEPEGIDEREVELRMALLRERYGERFAEPEQEAGGAQAGGPGDCQGFPGAPGRRGRAGPGTVSAVQALPGRRPVKERDAVFLPVRELAERVRTRQMSPVALTRLFLDRLERLGPHVQRGRHAHRRSGRAAGAGGGAGDRGGPLPGSAARHPVRPQGRVRHRRLRDHLGCGTAARPGIRLRRHHRPQAAGRRRRAGRQDGAGGAGRRHGLPAGGRLVHRARPQPVGPRHVERRLLQRLRVGGGCGARAVRDRYRDVGVDHGAVHQLRGVGTAAYLRPGEPARGHAAHLRDGQARTDVPHRGRLRPRARRGGRR